MSSGGGSLGGGAGGGGIQVDVIAISGDAAGSVYHRCFRRCQLPRFSDSGEQRPPFERWHGVKPVHPTLLFALDALTFSEIFPEVSVIMEGDRLGEIEPKPFGRGAATARHGLKCGAVPVLQGGGVTLRPVARNHHAAGQCGDSVEYRGVLPVVHLIAVKVSSSDTGPGRGATISTRCRTALNLGQMVTVNSMSPVKSFFEQEAENVHDAIVGHIRKRQNELGPEQELQVTCHMGQEVIRVATLIRPNPHVVILDGKDAQDNTTSVIMNIHTVQLVCRVVKTYNKPVRIGFVGLGPEKQE